MMVKHRVVITGIGVIAPNGIGKENFWYALKTGRCGIKRISFFDASEFPVRIAGEVHNFNPEDFIEKKKARKMARFSQFAVACSKMALEDAGLNSETIKNEYPGIVMGISSTDFKTMEEQCKILYSKGLGKINPFSSFISVPNAPSGEIAGVLGIPGFNLTVSTGCASGLDAVGSGYRLIRDGEARCVITGGSDCPVTPLMLATLCAADIMSKIEVPEKASRPFDKYRDGGVLSEGAAVVVLEEMESAIARGANIYGEITGYGQSIESKEEVVGSGLKRAIEKCFGDADISPDEVSYVSAHAPSDKLLDLYETKVLKDVFGSCIYRIPVSSIKGHTGNPYSAAGVMQLISVVMGMKEDIVVPTLNYEFPDPECDLDYVPNYPRKNEINIALVNSHGFGGANSSVLIRRFR
ncbi:MAG TPA: beta-ketoacyl-[acyl-carrier-protein] synthase family protein [bacterium]|nr:beta-ketoacyl-[acyl-carrier-protein] synthase family protein [bacterium]HPP30360.1 beta-ketoacyl-[acyl-carrier-protein] synthase family protein [bacterium]